MKMRTRIWTLDGRGLGNSVVASLLLGTAAACASVGEENVERLVAAHSTQPQPSEPMTCDEALSRITDALLSGADERPPNVLRHLNPFNPNSPCSAPDASTTIAFTPAPGGDSVHAAMRAFWTKLDAAWTARDLDGFIGLFAAEATFHVVAREALVEGREGIRARFAEQFSRQAPDLRHVTELTRVEHLGPGLAAIDAQVRVLRVAANDRAEPAVLRTFAVFATMTQNPDAWVIRDVRIYTLPEDR